MPFFILSACLRRAVSPAKCSAEGCAPCRGDYSLKAMARVSLQKPSSCEAQAPLGSRAFSGGTARGLTDRQECPARRRQCSQAARWSQSPQGRLELLTLNRLHVAPLASRQPARILLSRTPQTSMWCATCEKQCSVNHPVAKGAPVLHKLRI